MKLILMRHAEAAPSDNVCYPDDAQRPLTVKGGKTQQKVAQALKQKGILPTHIFVSPRLRARQTADITAQVLGLGHVVEEREELDGGYALAAVIALLRTFEGERCVLCVGHEPDMSGWAAGLLSPAQASHIHFVQSAVLGLEFAGAVSEGNGVLNYFYRPQDLLAQQEMQ